MDPSEVKIPELKNLTIDNITENVKAINSNCPDPRLKYILDRLVQHVHDFARETRLSHDEWMKGIHFLTAVGQMCTDVRQVSQVYQHDGCSYGLFHIRSSSYYQTFLVCPFSLTASITQSHHTAPKAQSSVLSTLTKRKIHRMEQS